MPIPSYTNARFPSNVVVESNPVDYNAPVVNPVVYPTKDIWKALWLAVSTDIQAGNTLTVGTTTYNIYGLQFKLTARNPGLPAEVDYSPAQTPQNGNYGTNVATTIAGSGNLSHASAGQWGTLVFTLADSANSADQLIGQVFEFPNYVFPGGSVGVSASAPAGGSYIAALV